MAYRARQGIDPATVSLAVVVQRMVDADAAGRDVHRQPDQRSPDEVVIGAAWGLGESVVSGSVNTDDLVVTTRTGACASRQTADKAVMTVVSRPAREEQPVPPDRRTAAVLDDAAAAELARIGVQIEAHFGAPQDIEWARVGDAFAILQSRPITALPLPEGDMPTDWTVPDASAFYFRASIVEQLPDPLSPLFADLIGPSVTRSLTTLLNEFVSRDLVREGDMGMPTFNGYAYYEYTRASLMRLLRVTPKAFLMMGGAESSTHGGDGETTRARATRVSSTRWTARSLDELPDGELMSGIVELLDAGTEYYTAVQTIIPIAATSEVLFTRYYTPRTPPVGSAGGDVPARFRQPADPRREVPLRRRGLGPRACRPLRVADVDAGARGGGAASGHRPCRRRLRASSGGVSRPTWTATGTWSTTSTSSTRCPPTTRPR